MSESSNCLLSKSLVFNQENPLLVSRYVNDRIGVHCIDSSRPYDKKSTLFHQTFGSLDLCRIHYGNPATVASSGIGDCYHLQLIMQGKCHSLLNHHKTNHQPGDLFMINPQDSIDLTYSSDCEKLIIKFPEFIVHQLCAEQNWGYPSTGVRFDSDFRLSMDDTSIFNLLSFICIEAERSHGNSILLKSCNEIMIRKLLDIFPSNIAKNLTDPQQDIFLTIKKYIENNIKKNPELTDILKVAPNISQRTLYSIFKKFTNMTPMNYIRERKMECIQAELCASGNSHNITSIAMNYGFFHLGRFSESYKKRFGVLPSDTIRLARQARDAG